MELNFERILTAKRLRTYPYVVLFGAVIGYGVFLGMSNGLQTVGGGRIGGDFPAFWGAGKIVAEGNSANLYSPDAQRAAQRGLLPHDNLWVHYAYPPHVALGYVPFSFLSFKTAYVLHTFMMGLAVFFAVRHLRPYVPPLNAYFGPAVAGALTFYPLYKAVVGGQNTAVSLLCVCAASAAIAGGKYFRAGLWLGLWAFKPQLALPAALVIALAYPRIVPGLAVGWSVLYAASSLIGGPLWPVWWWQDGVAPFAAAGLAVDRGNGISFREVASDLGLPFGWILAGLTMLGAIVLARTPGRRPLTIVALAAATSILLSPHALYYDAGLAVFGAVLAGSVAGPAVVIVGWLIGGAQPLRELLLLPPAMLVIIMMLWIACRELVRSSFTARIVSSGMLKDLRTSR